MKTSQRFTLMSLVLCAVAPTLNGCTNAEVANAVGAGAIIGGAILIGANSQCVAGYRTECHEYRDYWGVIRNECQQVYDSCAYLEPKNAVAVDAIAADSANAAAAAPNAADNADAIVNDVDWGVRFNISFESAQQFIDAMKSARAGNMDALTSIGLAKADVINIAQGKNVSDAGIDALAQKLGQDKDTVQAMVSELVAAAPKRK